MTGSKRATAFKQLPFCSQSSLQGSLSEFPRLPSPPAPETVPRWPATALSQRCPGIRGRATSRFQTAAGDVWCGGALARGRPRERSTLIALFEIGISYEFSFLFLIISVRGSTLTAVFTSTGDLLFMAAGASAEVVTGRFTKFGTYYLWPPARPRKSLWDDLPKSGPIIMAAGASAEVVTGRFTKIGTYYYGRRRVRGSRYGTIYQIRDQMDMFS